MSDVTQMTDEALVSELLNAKSQAMVLGSHAELGRQTNARNELLRRLALRDQQVTLAMAQQNVMDTMVRVHGSIQDETYRNLLDAMYEHVPKALAQLPWPQGSGALHPLPKEGWREVDDALAASTQDAPTEVKDGTRERAKQVLSDEIGDIAADKALAALTESANLTIVPANLLDAVIAAVDEAFCYNPVTKRSKIQVARTDVIAAIRAAWEGVTDGD